MSRDDAGPAVVNGILRRTSVSQVQTFDPDTYGGCHRKWWFEYIGGAERKETESQRVGKKIHAEIEHWLKTGEDVLSVTARQAKHFLPDRRYLKSLLIEHPIGTPESVKLFDEWRLRCDHVVQGGNDGADVFEAQEWEKRVLLPATKHVLVAAYDVPFIGYIDLVNGSGIYVDNDGVEHKDTADVEVVDWKTTTSIDSYSKTAADLATSTQMTGYAKWASQVYPDLKTFRLSHGNIQTKSRGSEKRSVVVDLDSVERQWQVTNSLVRSMKDVAHETSADKVEPHLPSCTAYRACPHAHICPKSPEQRLIDFGAGVLVKKKKEAEGAQINMGVMDLMTGRASAAPVVAPAAAKATEKVAAPALALKQQEMFKDPKEVASARAEFLAEEATIRQQQSAVVTCKAPGCGTVLTPDNSSLLPSGELVHIGCADVRADNAIAKAREDRSVLPPDAAKATPASSAEVVPGDVLLTLPPEVRASAQAHAAVVSGLLAGGVLVAELSDQAAETASKPSATSSTQPEAGPKAQRMCSKCGQPGHNARGCKNAEQQAPASPAVESSTPTTTPATPPPQAPAGIARLVEDVEERHQARVHASGELLREAQAGIHLFVDCIVQGITLTDLAPYVARKAQELAEATKLTDIRCAGQDSPLGYGKWKGALDAAIRYEPPAPGYYTISFLADDEIKRTAVASLEKLCTTFVRSRNCD